MTQGDAPEISARFFDIIYAGKDYPGEVARLIGFMDRVHPEARTLLDVGCGSGRHLELLRSRYQVEGVDLSEPLLDVARARLPGVPLRHGDMVEFDLGRRFDLIICLAAAIGYVTPLEGMRRAVGAMAAHLAPGGILFVEPWLTPEAFIDDKVVHNVYGDADLRLVDMYVQRRDGTLSIFDIHYLAASRERGVEHILEREVMGLYTDAENRAAFIDAGLDVVHASHGLHGYGAYLGRRGRAWSADDADAVAAMLDPKPTAGRV